MERYWIWMSELQGLTAKGKFRVLEAFGSPEAAYQATDRQIAKTKGLMKADKEALRNRDLTAAEEILSVCRKKEIGILTVRDPRYPELLRQIDDPPLLLYYAGTLPELDEELTIAVVGNRSATDNGKQIARKLGYELAAAGCVVISGCARGIDACAMEGAMQAGGTVVGVLGCGVDVVYPPENQRLFETVPLCGCLLSEYAPGIPPVGQHFPVRNRIISGLSRGVVVVEAPRRSGALITARLAMEQGRDVFAVPGLAGSSHCAGSNDLLRQGAAFTENGTDVVSGYAYLFPERVHIPTPEELEAYVPAPESEEIERNSAPFGDGADETVDKKDVDKQKTPTYIDVHEAVSGMEPDDAAVLLSLEHGPEPVDNIIEATGLSAQRVLGVLTLLEIRGLVSRLPGGAYSLKEISG